MLAVASLLCFTLLAPAQALPEADAVEQSLLLEVALPGVAEAVPSPATARHTVTYLTSSGSTLWWYTCDKGSSLLSPKVEEVLPDGAVLLGWVESEGQSTPLAMGTPVMRDMMLRPLLSGPATQAASETHAAPSFSALADVLLVPEGMALADPIVAEIAYRAQQIIVPFQATSTPEELLGVQRLHAPSTPPPAVSAAQYALAFPAAAQASMPDLPQTLQATYAVRVIRDGREADGQLRPLDGECLLTYDALSGRYSLWPDTLPIYFQADLFHNRIYLHQDASAWTLTGGQPFAASGGQWFLDVASWSHAPDGPLWIVYTQPVHTCSVQLFDDDGARLGEPFEVLSGGSVQGLDYDQNFLLRIPQGKREWFDGWRVLDGSHPQYPDKVSSPLSVAAAYRRLHTVSFYLNAADITAWHQLQVDDGTAIDWESVPSPSLNGYAFTGWCAYDTQTGWVGQVDNPTSPVHDSGIFFAQWAELATLSFVDTDGVELRRITAQVSQTLSPDILDGLQPPARANLTFSHWEDTQGIMLDTQTVCWSDATYRPIYTATVSFLDADAVWASRTVREGSALWDFPDAPYREGYIFLGWREMEAGTIINADREATSEYEKLPTPPPPAPTTTERVSALPPQPTQSAQPEKNHAPSNGGGGSSATTHAPGNADNTKGEANPPDDMPDSVASADADSVEAMPPPSARDFHHVILSQVQYAHAAASNCFE